MPGPSLWQEPVATAIGSLPGTEPLEACRLVFGELPDFPYLPELPGRGPWADMIGRATALLIEMPVDLQPSAWRLVDRPSRDSRRAVGMLNQDLDALDEVADGYVGLLKIQVCGPFTLAATLERTRGEKVLGDFGARRDLAQSLLEGVTAHVAEVFRRVPRARVVLQVDEPSLPAVLAGSIPTVSGFGRLRAVETAEVRSAMAALAAAVGVPVLVHCCAADAPFDTLRAPGIAGLSFDLATLDLDDDASTAPLAAAAEAGVLLVAGAVPTSAESPEALISAAGIERIRARVALWWSRLGQPPSGLATAVAVTPACGLAGASPAYARAAMAASVKIARQLAADPEPRGGIDRGASQRSWDAGDRSPPGDLARSTIRTVPHASTRVSEHEARPSAPPRKLGADAERLVVPDDFDEPLPEDVLDEFDGPLD